MRKSRSSEFGFTAATGIDTTWRGDRQHASEILVAVVDDNVVSRSAPTEALTVLCEKRKL